MSRQPESSRKGKRLLGVLMVLFVLFLGIGIGTLITDRVDATGPAESQLQMQSGGKPVAGAPALALSEAFKEVANRAKPAVVNINTESTASDSDSSEMFRRFFDWPFDLPQGPQLRRSLGSGVLVDPKGYIITNNHVVEGATKIKVRLMGGEEYTASFIGSDPISDIAVIKITRETPFPYAKIGNSRNMSVGDWVIAIGSPFELEQTVTAGIISAIGRTFENGSGPSNYSYLNDYLQTDASINRGNSGGPLLNMNAEVVGINSFISTPSGANAGVGFSVPSHLFTRVYNQILQSGKVSRGFVGVLMNPTFTPAMAKFFGVKQGSGVLITSLSNDEGDASGPGPAEKAGVQPEDVVIEFDGKKIMSRQDFVFAVAECPPGKNTKMKVVRGGQEKVLQITVGERHFKELEETKYAFDESDTKAKPELGLTIDTIPSRVVKMSNVSEGAYVFSVKPGSLAYDAGLSEGGQSGPGDIIVAVNGKPVTSPQDLSDYVKSLKSGDSMVLKFMRPVRQSGTKLEFGPLYTSLVKP